MCDEMSCVKLQEKLQSDDFVIHTDPKVKNERSYLLGFLLKYCAIFWTFHLLYLLILQMALCYCERKDFIL